MKKIISIILMVFIFCATVVINVNGMKVDIPFDYNASPIRVYAKADNGVVSVEACQGGIIKTTSLSDGQEQILKHINYENIYWIKYIDNEFIAFSDNYMLTSFNGYDWNVIEDRHYSKKDGTTMHELYGVDWREPSANLYSFDIEPDFEIIDSKYKREDGLNVYSKIVYTGQEWLKFEDTVFSRVADNYDDNGIMRSPGDFDRAIYRSADRQNWEYIETRESNYKKFEAGETDEIIPFPGFRYDADIQIINTGKEYLVRSTKYDDADDMHGYSWPMFVYDYNFNHVNTIEIDGNVVDMSYVDDVYYLTNDKNITYKSADLNNWEVVGENLGCPLSNGLSKIYKTRITIRNRPKVSGIYYNGIITAKDNLPGKNIINEGIMLFGTKKYGDFYVAFDRYKGDSKDYIDKDQVRGIDGNVLDIYRDHPLYDKQYIAFSKDGVYWATLDIPEPWYRIGLIDMSSEGLVIKCVHDNISTRYVSVKFSDMEKVVPNCDIRVELNNRVLGFSQPPVMEDDRTLVPMRFLFEQMGAEVDWNDTTQTATATVPVSAEQQMMTFSGARGGGGERNGAGDTNSVTFSIDNTNATVNGEAATMDVPARLINDQTFVPLRFLSENLGYDVQWDEATNTAIITTE